MREKLEGMLKYVILVVKMQPMAQKHRAKPKVVRLRWRFVDNFRNSLRLEDDSSSGWNPAPRWDQCDSSWPGRR